MSLPGADRLGPGRLGLGRLGLGRLGLGRLGPDGTGVLGWWVLTRLGFWLVALAAPWLFLTGRDVPGPLESWQQWDFWHFDRIAVQGYFAPEATDPEQAFFPGLPLLMRFGHWFGVPTVVSGLAISLVAGAVAAVALCRLAEREYGAGSGRWAALAWMVAPPAVFCVAPYTESLFLGFAIPAWLLARQGRWHWAALLAAGACSIRVSGIFLAIAIGVEFLVSTHRRWRDLPWLALPAAPVLGYMAYLYAKTGDWLSWYHAQAKGWYRGFTDPLTAFQHTWQAATGSYPFDEAVRANFEWMFRAELAAMVVGVCLTVGLLIARRWGEATWIGIQVVAFSTSFWFFSVPRASLLWFPLWIWLGSVAARRPWVGRAYLALSVPLAGVWAAAYLTGKWAG